MITNSSLVHEKGHKIIKAMNADVLSLFINLVALIKILLATIKYLRALLLRKQVIICPNNY